VNIYFVSPDTGAHLVKSEQPFTENKKVVNTPDFESTTKVYQFVLKLPLGESKKRKPKNQLVDEDDQDEVDEEENEEDESEDEVLSKKKVKKVKKEESQSSKPSKRKSTKKNY
jgi:hypothetical protein